VGLRNTRERLAVLYGPNHRFSVINSLPGLRIDMALPLEFGEAEPSNIPKTSASAAWRSSEPASPGAKGDQARPGRESAARA
jgi:hypothetical protein